MSMKRVICLFLCLLLLPVGMINRLTVRAETPSIEISVSVKENNGIGVPNTLYRRGFPLQEGKVFSLDDFGLYDENGIGIPSVFEVTERYKDGSIKWALCSFVTALRPDELKKFKIRNIGAVKITDKVEVSEISGGYRVKNSEIAVAVDTNGIKELSKGTSSFTDSITGYITLNGRKEQLLGIKNISILKHNDLYVKIKAEGSFGNFAVGEIVFTVASGTEKVEIEHRMSAMQDINIYSMGFKITPKSTAEFYYPETKYQRDNIVGSDYIYSKNSNHSLYLMSRDTVRFRAATTDADSTGFVFQHDSICFAPIIHEKSFLWYDGLSRTTKLTASFGEDSAQQMATMNHPPAVTIDPNQFAAAGIIAAAGSCTPIDRVIDLIHYDSDKRDGRLDAGALHYVIDPDAEKLDLAGVHPGEMEYNLAVAYMATGDTTIYDIICESAEFWADVDIYRGHFDIIYGANRYRTGEDYHKERFKMSHPYYGDPSGLYMTYVLSGDEYIGETFQLAMEHLYRNMYEYSDPNCGYRIPHMIEWYQTSEPVVRDYVEIRYLIQARPMYLAYGLFADDKYREAALEIARWGAATQSEDGWWYQVRYDNGGLFETMGQYGVKNYLIMYGLRGISFLSRYEDTPEIKNQLLRAGDFIKSEYENFGKGLWKPTGDVNLFRVDEDNTRSKGPYEDIMGMEILYCAYQISGADTYLKTLLDCTETWFSSMNPSGASVLFSNMEGYGKIMYLGGGQNYTVLMLFPELCQLFTKEAEKIKALGYDYILTAFDKNARLYEGNIERDSKYLSEVTQIVFENDTDKVLYATNHFGGYTGEYTKDYDTTIPEGGLWTGAENQISSPGAVTLYKHMKQYDRILAIHTPIYITSMSDSVTAYVDEYSETKAVFRVYGSGEMNICIKDGKLPIKNGESYSVTVARDGTNGAKISICNNCVKNRKATEEGLSFKIILSKNFSLSDTESVSAYAAVNSGLMSMNGNAFQPELPVDSREFQDAAYTITDIEKEFDGSTYNDAANYALELIYEISPEYFDNNGIMKKNITAVGTDISDSEAVRIGAEFLTVPACAYFGFDTILPQKSVGECLVEWKSNHEAVTVEGGILNIRGADISTAELTAIIQKGNASIEKKIDIAVKKTSDVDWYANSQSNMESKHLLNRMTGEFEIAFSMIPNAANTNAIVGFSSTDVKADVMRDIPILFRLDTDGAFDAINKDAYCALEYIPYEVGKKYNVRMEVSIPKRQYNVFVAPEGESEMTLGRDFAFRETALLSNNINVAYTPTATMGTKLFHITYMNCAALPEDYSAMIPLYDENRLMFGKYAENFLYLPDYAGDKKLTWMSSDKSIITNRGEVKLKDGIENLIIYGIQGEADTEFSAVDILKKLCLIEYAEGKEEVLSRQQAAEILGALRYVVRLKQQEEGKVK